MKKLKGFTLLETVLVIVIIGIVSVSLLSFRKNTQENKDIVKDALSVFYKEMNSSIKDFQRNKIWETASGVAHEMTYLYLNFNNDSRHGMRIGNDLVIGNIYLYTGNNGKTRGHFDGSPLILEQEYSAFQALKGSNKYKFYIRNKGNSEIKSILIANNGTIFEGYLEKIITSTGIRIDENGNAIRPTTPQPLDRVDDNQARPFRRNDGQLTQKEIIKKEIKPNTENPLQRLTFNFEIEKDTELKRELSRIENINNHVYEFLVCGGYGDSDPQPIGKISINAITQATNLERCENEKYAGINCNEFASCN